MCRSLSLRAIALLLALGVVTVENPAYAADSLTAYHATILSYFPRADRVGAERGKPPSAPVYRGKQIVGYAFHSKLVAPIPAYSGQPIDILMALDNAGKIVGAKVLEQHEPILLVGIPVQRLYDFVAQYVGHKVTDDVQVGGDKPGEVHVDAISSATVTTMVTNRTIMRSAYRVAVARDIIKPIVGRSTAPAKVRMDVFAPGNWRQLVGRGDIRHLVLTAGQVNDAFGRLDSSLKRHMSPQHSKAMFAEIYYAYLNAPSIGRNLLGKDEYTWLMKQLKPGEHAIAVFGNGYSFKGSGYVRGGIFDRLHLIQGGQPILFHDLDYIRLEDTAPADVPDFTEKAIFIVRKGNEFDPGKPWQVEFLVRRQTGPVKSAFVTFQGDYKLADAYVVKPKPVVTAAASDEPMWVGIWRRRRFDMAFLVIGLGVLSAILVFQDVLVRRPRLFQYMRNGFLVYTVGFIGWWALAQLSVVNVFTFLHAFVGGFRWQSFLLDPMLFILWSFVAITLLLWGRGIFCGWLCPFGALQELIGKISHRFLKLRQFELPTAVHERLWTLKYAVLLILFGISLQSVSQAERYAEIEPFKTAISLHFHREWPFVLYASALLAVTAVNRKFYCKYICPLGAALAVAGRWRLFTWLRRRKQCGNPCQICANECEIRAIDRRGEINMNECHYCLDCQLTYWNDHKCPPLILRQKRLRRSEEGRRQMKKFFHADETLEEA